MYFNSQDICDKLRFLNRTECFDGKPAFEWSASGFEMRFSGEGVGFAFEPIHTEMPIYIAVFLDGQRQNFAVSTGSEVFRSAPLPGGEHTLRFLKITEPRHNDIDPRLILSRVYINGEGAALLPPPPEKQRKITIIGDSITCGYGVRSVGHNESFKSYEEDVTCTYGYITAKHFDADYQIVSISGQGIVCRYDGLPGIRVPVFFEQGSKFLKDSYNHSIWNPDVVVINAGTNDECAHADREDFEREAREFLHRIRAVYPSAKIIWLYGMMGGNFGEKVSNAIASLKESESTASLLSVSCIRREDDEVGTAGHPNEKGQLRGAQALIRRICEMTGWK